MKHKDDYKTFQKNNDPKMNRIMNNLNKSIHNKLTDKSNRITENKDTDKKSTKNKIKSRSADILKTTRNDIEDNKSNK